MKSLISWSAGGVVRYLPDGDMGEQRREQEKNIYSAQLQNEYGTLAFRKNKKQNKCNVAIIPRNKTNK